MNRWLLIAGDFTPLGGMDRANHALASSLAAAPGAEVHLVAHRVWRDLEQQKSVHVDLVRRPFGSHFAGGPFLAAEGQRRAKRFTGGCVIANGGNADAGDVTWVHYLHAAYAPRAAGIRARFQGRAMHQYYLAHERRALTRARIVLCNSQRTASDVHQRLGIGTDRTRVVYYGSDPEGFAVVSDAERASARQELGWAADRPVVLFIGALGDRRKGFDRVFTAWQELCRDPGWDADLAVAGHGGELSRWRRLAAEAGLGRRITFLGFRNDVSRVLAAADALVHPARYEAYGLGVHEALCRGLPAIVSAAAGVAELYPADLSDLLIQDVEDTTEIAERLHRWRGDMAGSAARVRAFADRLRSRTWADMSADIRLAVGA
ncbi:MAG: glycosyltransferase family 4 protein [Acidobacteriota bacterium]